MLPEYEFKCGCEEAASIEQRLQTIESAIARIEKNLWLIPQVAQRLVKEGHVVKQSKTFDPSSDPR